MQAIRWTIRVSLVLALLGLTGGTVGSATAVPDPLPRPATQRAVHCDGGLALELALSAIATAP